MARKSSGDVAGHERARGEKRKETKGRGEKGGKCTQHVTQDYQGAMNFRGNRVRNGGAVKKQGTDAREAYIH